MRQIVTLGLLNSTCSSLSGKQLETLDSETCVCSCFTCEDGLTGSAWGDWSLYTASPLRAEDAEEPPKPPPFDPAKQAVFFLHGANYLARNYQYVWLTTNIYIYMYIYTYLYAYMYMCWAGYSIFYHRATESFSHSRCQWRMIFVFWARIVPI